VIALLSPLLGRSQTPAPAQPWRAAVIGSSLMWFAPGDQRDPGVTICLGIATIGVEFAMKQCDDAVDGAARQDRAIVRKSAGPPVMSAASQPDPGADFWRPPGYRRTPFVPPLFGLDPVTHQGRIAGPLTGIWFIVFVLPMFLLTPDYPVRRPLRAALREGLSGLKRTLGELPKQKAMATFLLANMIYTDGLVSLFAFGGIYAAGTFGWHTIQIGTFGILLAIAGTFGAWLGGKLDDTPGPSVTPAVRWSLL
jgi:UMF1 family MFS transporter